MPIKIIQKDLNNALNKLYKPPFNATELTIKKVFNTFNIHNNLQEVIAKIILLDYIYSTNLKKLKIDVVDFAIKIMNISDIDSRLSNGDVTLVEEIANLGGDKKPFSFATKYCCLHNYYVYGKDDYSIVDSNVKKELPKYINTYNGKKITKHYLNCLQKNNNYKEIHNIIGQVLINNNVSGRRAFDLLMWK